MSSTTPIHLHQDGILMAFTAEQVSRLSGISPDRLRYWEKTETFEPFYVEQRKSGPFRKIYSFQDLVNLRAIARLRTSFGVPLKELRNVTAYLRNHRDTPWSRLAVRVYGRHLVFRDPMTNQWMVADPTGQLSFELEFADIREESEQEARKLMRRSPAHYGQVTKNRNVMSNQWVVAGTRIPVAAVVSFHREGYSKEQILAEYPTLVGEDIDAAIKFEEQTEATA